MLTLALFYCIDMATVSMNASQVEWCTNICDLAQAMSLSAQNIEKKTNTLVLIIVAYPIGYLYTTAWDSILEKGGIQSLELGLWPHNYNQIRSIFYPFDNPLTGYQPYSL